MVIDKKTLSNASKTRLLDLDMRSEGVVGSGKRASSLVYNNTVDEQLIVKSRKSMLSSKRSK